MCVYVFMHDQLRRESGETSHGNGRRGAGGEGGRRAQNFARLLYINNQKFKVTGPKEGGKESMF